MEADLKAWAVRKLLSKTLVLRASSHCHHPLFFQLLAEAGLVLLLSVLKAVSQVVSKSHHELQLGKALRNQLVCLSWDDEDTEAPRMTAA